MSERLQELFRYEVKLIDPRENSDSDYLRSKYASANFFKRVLALNLSWDQLFTGKTYPFLSTTKDPFLPRFFTDLAPTQIPAEKYPGSSGSWVFPETNSAIAGALSTKDFVERYPTTPLNKNRKRAAAVFRILLCDDMKPAFFPTAPEQTNSAIHEFFSNDEVSTTTATATMPAQITPVEDLHGSSPSCMSCHYKLDPLGKAFEKMNLTLGEPSPGRLVYRRENGDLVDISGNGLGDLTQAITQQPEYARCQVKRLWSWFIGTDAPLSEKKTQELVQNFNRLGRATQDFVGYLVNRPEFIDSVLAMENRSNPFLKAKSALHRCDSCHAGESVPSFTHFPIGGSEQAHRESLLNIADRLDLAHDGRNATMPDASGGWTPHEVRDASTQIRAWLCAGAPGDSGQPTIYKDTLPQGICP